VLAAFGETAAGPGDDLTNGRGHQYLASSGERGDSGTDMDGHPGDVGTPDLNFAGVHTGSHLDAENPHRVDDGRRTFNGSTGAAEGGNKAVTRGVDLAPTEPIEFVADDVVVVVQEVSPPIVAEIGGPLRRTDDIGENDCGEGAFGLGPTADTSDELFDFVQ